MKNLITTSTLLLALFFTNNTYAKIWRVNNTPAVVADFTTVQAAHDAASAGDTIHIEASVSGYASVTVTKQIVLIGDGYFLTTDTLLQANTNTSSLNTVTFAAGSANSVMEGLNVNYVYLQTDHILVKRNYIGYYIYLYTGANNCTVSGNYFGWYAFSEQSGPISNLYIGNNIFVNYLNVSLSTAVAGTFENNVVYTGYNLSLYNFQVDNNIMYNCGFTPNNSVYFNNIGNTTQFGNANSNQQNVTMATVFLLSGSADAQF